MNFLGQLLINILALFVASNVVPGFTIDNLKTALITAILIGVSNTFIKPLLKLITLPLTVITLGLWAFFINVFLLLVIANLVPGFEIASFMTAVFASILLSLVSAFLSHATD